MAWKGEAALRHHAALGRIDHAGAARGGGRTVARISRFDPANAHRREPRRGRLRHQPVSGAQGLPRHYDHYGLVRRRTILRHGVWFSDSEFARVHERDASIAHCPTSNLFLGSGLFRLRVAKDKKRPIHVGLGTDIGAGTSFSVLRTINEAYKIAALNASPISAFEAFYLATLGGARSLGLEDRIGSLEAGREADIVVLEPKATPLLAFRENRSRSAGRDLVRADDPWRRPRRARHLCGRGACPCARPG